MQPLTAALDNAFPDDLDEIIERVLLRYRPILSHLVMTHYWNNLQHAFRVCDNLSPWLSKVPFHPAQGIGSLTAAQVALLGGTRPARILRRVASELVLRLDGGDGPGRLQAAHIVLPAGAAMFSFGRHHVAKPQKGWEATARALYGFARLGIAAQIAATLGGLHEHNLWAGSRERDDQPELIQRYFLGVMEAFGRITLSRKDQDTLRAHYLDAGKLDELADERDGLAAEVARRRAFLDRFATALEAQIDLMTGAAARDDAPVLVGASDAVAETRALTQAAGPAARPRKR